MKASARPDSMGRETEATIQEKQAPVPSDHGELGREDDVIFPDDATMIADQDTENSRKNC